MSLLPPPHVPTSSHARFTPAITAGRYLSQRSAWSVPRVPDPHPQSSAPQHCTSWHKRKPSFLSGSAGYMGETAGGLGQPQQSCPRAEGMTPQCTPSGHTSWDAIWLLPHIQPSSRNTPSVPLSQLCGQERGYVINRTSSGGPQGRPEELGDQN